MISGARYHRVATYPVISSSVCRAKPKSRIWVMQRCVGDIKTTKWDMTEQVISHMVKLGSETISLLTLSSQSSFTARLLGFKSWGERGKKESRWEFRNNRETSCWYCYTRHHIANICVCFLFLHSFLQLYFYSTIRNIKHSKPNFYFIVVLIWLLQALVYRFNKTASRKAKVPLIVLFSLTSIGLFFFADTDTFSEAITYSVDDICRVDVL